MKKVISTLSCLLLVAVTIAQTTISSDEREKALNHLKKTQAELISMIDNFSEEQVNFKANDNSWSIAECLEHITISEQNLIGMVQMSLQEEADPSRRSEITLSDDQLLGIIVSREQKVKTREEFEPTKSFGGFNETLKVFKKRRKANLKFVKNTDADLRNHYVQLPFGLIDTYQGILFLSGHTQRHTDQIKEIIGNPDFPE